MTALGDYQMELNEREQPGWEEEEKTPTKAWAQSGTPGENILSATTIGN